MLVPQPSRLRYPTLLGDDTAQAGLLGYAVETVVAEKFQAMVVLGTLNSRAKDFFDLYVISQREVFKATALRAALTETFSRRETPLADAVYLFDPAFAGATTLVQAWARLQNANPTLGGPADFAEVMVRLQAFLEPLVSGRTEGVWQPEPGTWSRI